VRTRDKRGTEINGAVPGFPAAKNHGKHRLSKKTFSPDSLFWAMLTKLRRNSAMQNTEGLNRARAVFLETRQIWFADGILDAHERLALITVASGLRDFAFLSHLTPQARKSTVQLLQRFGLNTRFFSAQFDLDIRLPGVNAECRNAYNSYKIRNERFFGIGVCGIGKAWPENVTLTGVGSALGYPDCCVRMDIGTKKLDHRLFLRGLVREVGNSPEQVTWALQNGRRVEKASYSHLRSWGRRFELTMARFPFALHTACNECLQSPTSRTAALSQRYETLAKGVSEELHNLIRWAAHIGSGGRDR
jgi:hypothetical protein